MIRLQERDKRILRHCYDQQFLRALEVVQSHFRGVHKSEAYRRLQELEESGYLRRERPFPCSTDMVFRLTKQGRGFVEEQGGLEVPQLSRLNPSTLGHDAIVTTVRLRLERFWEGHWIPEQLLRKTHGETHAPDAAIGDGMFVFPSKQQMIAVEVENSLKGKERYQRLFRNWAKQDPGPVLVLYVATASGIYDRLRSYLTEAPADQPFGLVLLSDLLKDPPPRVWTLQGEIELFKRKELS